MNMKKKLYVSPSLEVVEMECLNNILGSSNPNNEDVGIGDDMENGTTETKKLDAPFNHTWE